MQDRVHRRRRTGELVRELVPVNVPRHAARHVTGRVGDVLNVNTRVRQHGDPGVSGFVGVPPGPVAVTGARLLRERNRLAFWEVRVEMAAGEFLNWCDGAGIEVNGRTVKFPERLRYRPKTW